MTKAPPDVIAIDGPSGSGKGTVAGRVAAALGWRLLDSGALYRAVALAALRRGTDFADETALAALAGNLDIAFESGAVRIDGEDATTAIRAAEMDAPASQVAALAGVRAALLDAQRRFRAPPGLVADGRDMGTEVFPDARLKVFLTASAEERARRRFRQLKDRGADVSLPALREGIRRRDARDRSRAVSPLAPAPEAVTIDSTEMPADAVTAAVLALAEERNLRRR